MFPPGGPAFFMSGEKEKQEKQDRPGEYSPEVQHYVTDLAAASLHK